MATESSAIARLVADAQNQGMPGPDGVFEPLAHPSDPPAGTHRAPPPVKTSSSNPWWLLVVAVIVIGGSVAGGYLLAQQQGEPGELAAEGAGLGVDSANVLGGLASGASVSAEEAEATVMPPVPAVAAPVAVADAAVPEEVETEMEPELGVDALALAAKTGFDILVEPKGAKVTLDGNAIGAAPLRVRNLLPGTHRIDIEGPDGYFGQHQEFALGAGEAMVLRLSLDALGAVGESAGQDAVAKSDEGEEKAAPKAKKLTRRQRLRARREARNKKRGKATAAPSASEERALAGAGAVSLGTLMLGAKPPCEIVINGKKTGLSTPQRSIQLPEGMHRVVLINDEHNIRKSFKVRIKSGRTTRAIQDLTKKL